MKVSVNFQIIKKPPKQKILNLLLATDPWKKLGYSKKDFKKTLTPKKDFFHFVGIENGKIVAYALISP